VKRPPFFVFEMAASVNSAAAKLAAMPAG